MEAGPKQSSPCRKPTLSSESSSSDSPSADSPSAGSPSPFAPFAVQCLTCGSRLRVTDPTVVGTIAACPKCQSMVQIDPPATPAINPATPKQVTAGNAAVDSGAITESAIASDGIELRDGAPPVAGGFSDFQNNDIDAPPTAMNPLGFESESARRSKQIALVTALSLSTLLVAVFGFIWFIRSYQPAATVADAESPVIAPENESSPPMTETPPTEAESVESETIEPSPAEQEPQREPEPENTPTDPAPVTKEPIIPVDLMPKSPFGPDLKPREMRDAAKEAEVDPDASRMMDLPPGLAQFTPFLLQDSATEIPTLQAPPTMDELAIEDAVEDDLDPLEKIEPRKINLKSDLAIKMAFRAKDYPLVDLILMVSQITGVPIQIDWVSFDLAAIEVSQRIAVPKEGTSADKLLDLIAASVQGEIQAKETLLILTVAEPVFTAVKGDLVSLDDFGDDAASAEQVMMNFLQPSNPIDGVDVDVADADLADVAAPRRIIEPRQADQLAAMAAETLRRMRGVAPKVSDERIGRWVQTDSTPTIEWPKLSGGDPGPTTDTPVTLASFLRRISQANDAVCLVNWYDANRRGIFPERLLLPDVRDDAAATVQRTIAPLGMSIRQVDAGHWWVGSDATYDRLPVVLCSPPLGPARDAFFDQLDRIMAGGDHQEYRLTYDPVSDRALMLLPRFVVRQLPKVTDRLVAN